MFYSSTIDTPQRRSLGEEAIHGKLQLRSAPAKTLANPKFGRSISLDDEFLSSPSSSTFSPVFDRSLPSRTFDYKPSHPSEAQNSAEINSPQSQRNIEIARQKLAKVRDSLEHNVTNSSRKPISPSETLNSLPMPSQSQINIEIARNKLAKVRDSLEQDIANPTMKTFPFLSTRNSFSEKTDSSRISTPSSSSFGKDSIEFQDSFTDYISSTKNASLKKPTSRAHENATLGISRNLQGKSTLSSLTTAMRNDAPSFKFPDVPTHHQTISLSSTKPGSGSYSQSRNLSSNTRSRFQSSVSFDETRLTTSHSASVHRGSIGLSSLPNVRPLPMESMTLVGARPKHITNPLPGRRPLSTTIPPRRVPSRRLSIL